MRISVICASPERTHEVHLQVPDGTNIKEAVRQSRIADAFPELDIDSLPIGIYGHRVEKADEPHTLVSQNDRIEIYLPLRRNARKLG